MNSWLISSWLKVLGNWVFLFRTQMKRIFKRGLQLIHLIRDAKHPRYPCSILKDQFMVKICIFANGNSLQPYSKNGKKTTRNVLEIFKKNMNKIKTVKIFFALIAFCTFLELLIGLFKMGSLDFLIFLGNVIIFISLITQQKIINFLSLLSVIIMTTILTVSLINNSLSFSSLPYDFRIIELLSIQLDMISCVFLYYFYLLSILILNYLTIQNINKQKKLS